MWNRIPWWMRFYVVLLGGSIFLLLVSMGIVEFHGSSGPANDVFKLASDAFKTILGAVIGALSATINRANPATAEGSQKS